MGEVHLIRSQTQLSALVAAARQEIVDVLEQMGTVSVAELAATLGRPADALYFHLRALVRAGLVRNAGPRARPGGTETLYRTIAPELRLKYEPALAANRDTISAIVASMLRLATRDFVRSLGSGQVVVDGPHRELLALRKVGRLSRAQIARLNRGIAALVREVSASRGRGRLYAVTLTLTPLDHRNKVAARRRRKAA
jgi:DNA-binding transcriptional ArsR family regulator